MSQINQKNGELEALNEELIEYSSTIEELAVVKERNRFARDVHDTVGRKITLLIALLRVLKISLGSDPETSRKKVDEAVNVAKESLQDLRGSIAGLVYNEKVSENLKESILRACG
ncbi:MAG: histidine kinase [Bacillota bacterium]